MKKIYLNINGWLATETLTSTSGISRIQQKRGTNLYREIVFHEDGVLVSLKNLSGIVVMKEKQADGDYTDVPSLPAGPVWEKPRGEGDGYKIALPIYGPAIIALPQDSSKGRTIAAEIQVDIDGEPNKSQTFDIYVTEPVGQDDETELENPELPFGSPAQYIKKANNLADLPGKAAARAAIGAAAAADLVLQIPRSELGEPLGPAPLNEDGTIDPSFIGTVPVEKIGGYIEKQIILGPGLGWSEDGTTISIFLTGLDYGTTPP